MNPPILLAAMIALAKREKQWLRMGSTLVSPEALEAANAKGELLYDPVCWDLVNVEEYISELREEVDGMIERLKEARTWLEGKV